VLGSAVKTCQRAFNITDTESMWGNAVRISNNVAQEVINILRKKNPGLDIASLAKNKVHVLWRRNDITLFISALEKLRLPGLPWWDVEGRNIPIGALGRNGNCYGNRNIHDKLKNKVVFHNCHDFSNEPLDWKR
jgi:hypothetical protein